MAAVYIVSEYGRMSKAGQNLIFTGADGTSSRITLEDTELLVMNGHVSITGECLRMLAGKHVPTYILENGAVPNISLSFGDSRSGFLRQKQYLLLADTKSSLSIAKTIVKGKIRNELTFLSRIERSPYKKAEEEESLAAQITRLKALLKKAANCKTKESLRGIEGNAAREYFSLFGQNLSPGWALFEKRSHRPPKTNVNAVLSYLYTLLTGRVQNALEAAGLDTMCSNLHEMSYGKDSLAFDIVEEFRTPVADTLCCSLFNHGTLHEDDFEESDGGVYLTRSGSAKTAGAFEAKLSSKVKYPATGDEESYMQIIFEQAVRYKRFIKSGEPYVPFAMK